MTLQKRKWMLFASLLTFILLFFAFNHSITAYAEEPSGSEVETTEQSDTNELVGAKAGADENAGEEVGANEKAGAEVEAVEKANTNPVNQEEQDADAEPAKKVVAAEQQDRNGGTPQEVNAEITRFDIERPQGTPLTEVNKNYGFYLAMDWNVKDPDSVLQSGDYFDIKLPDNVRFPPNFTTPVFDLKNDQGEVIATGQVTPGENDYAGGSVRITFNDGINDKYNVKGTLYLYALFNKKQIQDNQINTFTVEVQGEPTSTEVKVTKVGVPADQVLSKWGETNGNNDNEVKWYVNINYAKRELKNAIISDQLTGDATYVDGTFKLTKVEYNDEGGVVRTIEEVDLTDKLTISDDQKTFTINLGDGGTDQYHLSYVTTYPGGKISNKVKIASTDVNHEHGVTFEKQGGGGTAGGDLASKIKITKVDAEDNTVVLAGAVFEVTRPNGTTFMLTTGADGTVTSELLSQGTYRVKEVTAPVGYELNGEEFTLEVTPDGGVLRTVTNARIKINVTVTKKWVGPVKDSVTVHLLANGNDTGKSAVLNAANNWTAVFENLNKYADEEIVYSVIEDAVENYNSTVDGDADTGFTITNTNTETTAVNVVKNWIGPKTGSVTVRLLADGIEVGNQVLNEENQWKYSFTGLKVYNADGSAIVYTVTEDAVANYESDIEASEDGYVITNTITGKVSIPVTKVWKGEALDQVTIRLYADGKEVATCVLNAANGWTYTFADFDKYSNGNAITYTIQEDATAGYTTEITGSVEEGFTVTNTKEETPKEETPEEPSEPEKPKDPITPVSVETTPNTGTNTNTMMWIGMMFASVCLAGAMLLVSRKRQEQ